MDRYLPQTNHFVKVVVGFEFHFNQCNGLEKIVDEKIDNVPPSINTYIQ